MLSILYIGPLNIGGTCYNRLQALLYCGYSIVPINTGYSICNSFLLNFLIRVFRFLFNQIYISFLNKKIIKIISTNYFDVIWVDKGLHITPDTLLYIKLKLPSIKLLSYSPDDMFNPNNSNANYFNSIPLYDLHVTTKSYNFIELKNAGAKNVLFCNNSFSPFFHKSYSLSNSIKKNKVGFIGSYELERYNSLLFLATNGIRINIFGDWPKNKYKPHPNLIIKNKILINKDYASEISNNLINICFLRKVNRDLQTTRSIEIPACGGFMLAEKTDEHISLFKCGIEAEYFISNEDLLKKCEYYLANPDKANLIAKAGYEKCHNNNYDDISLVKKILLNLI